MILIVRDDGVIRVENAVPVDFDVQAQIDAICDMLGAGPRPEADDLGDARDR